MTDDKTHQTMTLRLAIANWRKLEALSTELGVTKTNVIAMAIQEMAERRGIRDTKEGQKD